MLHQYAQKSPYSDPDYRADPYAWYAQWRDTAPVLRTTLPNGAPVYVVTRYADVLAALKDVRLCKNRYAVENPRWWERMLGLHRLPSSNMLKADPPDHTRLRRLASGAFQPRNVAMLHSQITERAERLVAAMPTHAPFDLMAMFALPFPIQVIMDMLDIPARDHARFHAWSSQIIASGFLSGEQRLPSWGMIALSRYMRGFIAQRRRHLGDDVMSQLITADIDGDRLSELELVSTTILFLIAGHETTVNLIGNGMLALLQQPAAWQAICADPERIPAITEELLRLTNPVQLVNRYATVDLEIAGVPIPRGAHVQLVIAAANHDEHVFARPMDIDLDRHEMRHVAFSQGIHYCVGAPLARLEMQIALQVLTRLMPHMHLAEPNMTPQWRHGVELRGLVRLPVLSGK